MIPTAAVDDYLARELDSHLWMKGLSEADVDRALAAIHPRPWLWPGDAQNPKGLRLHQKVSILLGIAYPGFGFWLDMGCVDGDTEYLSPVGWARIAGYTAGPVAQYDPGSRTATFVSPTRYVQRPCQEMTRFKTERGCDQMVSDGHKMLVVGGYNGVDTPWRSKWKHTPVVPLDEYRSEKDGNTPWLFEVFPADVAGKSQVRFETTFLLDGSGISLSDAEIRVQVAVHADGYIPKSKVTVCVKKERKKKRMRQILAAARIEYKEHDRKNGYTSFYFIPPRLTKKYGADWWDCSLAQKEVICSEVVHWDGSVGKSGSFGFYSRSRSCADFIQFCFASTRRRAYMNTGVKPSRDGGRDYSVHAVGNGRTTNLAHLRGAKRVSVPDGKMYCFEVPTGYLVLRRNGNIFITGNSGKTLVALTLLRYWWDTGALRRALIFVTSDKAFLTWEKQIRRFGIGLPFTALEGPSEDKWRQLEELDEGLVLVTRPGAVAMVSKKVVVKHKGKKPKLQLKLIDAKVAALAKWAGGIVWDESTRESNSQSLQYRLADKLRKHAYCRYALAGRPFGRDQAMLFPQYKLIDGGETLGEMLGLFRSVFFTEQPLPWNEYAKEYRFCEDRRADLSRIIQHRSITYTADECVDLPPVVPIIEEVSFPTEAESYYRRVVKELIKAKGNYRAAKNAFLRMRQVSSGFVGVVDDETGAKAQIEFVENPKLDRLLDLLEDMPESARAVIFYEFTYSGRRIVEALKSELGDDPIWLWSGTKDARGEINRFLNDDRCRTAVIQSKVGAFSLDGLQDVANYTFFFESPVSPIDREQAQRRLERDGQKHKVLRYDLIVRGSMDQRILDFHREGEELMEALMRDPARMLEA